MTGNSEDYLDFVLEQLHPLPALRNARLFGGHCIYAGDKPFALLIANTLYFAVDDTTRPRYEAMGSRCFSYRTKLRQVDVKKYYEVPADMLEDAERLRALADEAVGIATVPKKKVKKTKRNSGRA